jgi:hypothetical protein
VPQRSGALLHVGDSRHKKRWRGYTQVCAAGFCGKGTPCVGKLSEIARRNCAEQHGAQVPLGSAHLKQKAPAPDALLQGFGKLVKPCLACGQRGLGALAFGDLLGNHIDADMAPSGLRSGCQLVSQDRSALVPSGRRPLTSTSRMSGRKDADKTARQPDGDQAPGATCSIAPISRLAAKGLCRKAMQPAL